MKLLQKLFGKKARLIVMNEQDERKILWEMNKIEGIRDYLEIHTQAGYQLFGKTRDERYLGYVDLANSIIAGLNKLKVEKDDLEEEDGYVSTV